MDPRLSSFLNKLAPSLDLFPTTIPAVESMEALKDHDWDTLVDIIYGMYHHEGQRGPDRQPHQEAFDRMFADLAQIDPKGVWQIQRTNDMEFLNGRQKKQSGRGAPNEFRVYVNTDARHAERLGRFLIKDVFKNSPEVFGFKMARRVQVFQTVSDPVVLYCNGSGAAAILAGYLSYKSNTDLKGVFRSPCVEFAEKEGYADGIAVGESPRDWKCSFGELRALALAKACRWHLYRMAAGQRSDFTTTVSRACRDFQIDPDRIYRNARGQSSDFYERRYDILNRPLERQAAASRSRGRPRAGRATRAATNAPTAAARRANTRAATGQPHS